MKPETEMVVRNILSSDAEISKECLEQAMDILRNNGASPVDLVHVVRFKEAEDILKVHRLTLQYYLNNGYLDRVYGCGKRAIGVSRESLLRFISRRSVRRTDWERKRAK